MKKFRAENENSLKICAPKICRFFDVNDNATIYFFDQLIAFQQVYTVIHRYLCLFVCFIGVILNSLHFYVLT
ncbi:unnamed protein product [Caenorhabditis angaria]|uniref:Uncharacterized protein n=1 Tax=Caenorhabditis angaria TaxID=860376 RepID=A0A9P1N1H6_9PELO|nr:unnamed protein product [Caenorhabditis angaria]